MVVYQWGFSNRGSLTGPYCIVYGFGALLLILCLHRLQQKEIRIGRLLITPVLVFVGIVIITTVVELIASYISEYLTGSWMWDYTRFAWDFQGRIAPNPSIRFGLGGMVFLYVFQPLFKRLTGAMNGKILSVVFGALLLIMGVDAVYTFFLK